jgi:phosphoglycolate phosphatase
MTAPGKSLLLFDFDGVLVDSLALYSEAVRLILEKIGTPIVKSREDYLALFDGNFYESMAARGVNLSAFSSAAKEILPGLDYRLMKPFPGLSPVLSALQEENLLVVVSSNGSHAIGNALDNFALSPYFEDILGSDFLFSKQEKIGHALSKFGFAPDSTYYIGDTTGDIVEARAAGILTVAAAWGWHGREKLATASPDFLIDVPDDLLHLEANRHHRD